MQSIGSLSCHVISLARTPERFGAFKRTNDSLISDLTRFDAVDGHKVPGSILPWYSHGNVGALKSHVEILRNARGLTAIFEDDAILRLDFEAALYRCIGQLPADWDILSLGWNWDAPVCLNIGGTRVIIQCDQSAMRQYIKTLRMNKNCAVFRNLGLFGTVGYCVRNTNVAYRLYRVIEGLKGGERIFIPQLGGAMLNTAYDIAMHHAYATMNCYVAFPPLLYTMNDHSISTVQNQ